MGPLCAGPLVRAASGYIVKILHVIPSVASRYGGPSRAVVEMCRALEARGVDVLIATTDADGTGRLDVKIGEQVYFENVPAIFFPRQWSEAFKYSRPLAQWLQSHVAEFDVVHIHAVFSHASLAAAAACRKQGVPYVVRPLGTLDPWSLQQKQLKKRLFWQLGVQKMLKGAAAIHYTTQAEQELAEGSLGISGGVVIPLGIETHLLNERAVSKEREEKCLPSIKPPYVLVMSRLHQKKGLEVLLPAFLSLVKKPEFAKWQLVLAGEGESAYVASLKSLVKSGGGNGNVVFAGWLEEAQRENALRDASLLALTSYQENFGLCILEALAEGVPVVISSDVNLAKDIADAKAGWITKVDVAGLERTLSEAMADKEQRFMRGLAGKAFSQNFTWENIAEKLESMYLSIIKSHG